MSSFFSSFRGARLRANPESRLRCGRLGRLDSGFAARAAPRNDTRGADRDVAVDGVHVEYSNRSHEMKLHSLGYVGIRTGHLEDWTAYAARFLGMQQVDRSATTAAFRMDDRKQRLLVQEEAGEGPAFYGWETADAAAMERVAADLERAGVKVARGPGALAGERRVKDLIVFADPIGNRLEVFHGPEIAADPFMPGRAFSGFRTGPFGMGHAVLTTERLDEVVPFYTDVLGFALSDYISKPFGASFFHTNPRHHSLAF